MASFTDGMAAIFRDVLGDEDLVPYTHGLVTVNVRPIPEMPSITIDGVAEVRLVDADASASFVEADLPAGYGEGDIVVIRGTTYRAKVPMRDGRGMVRIPLRKA